MIVCEVHITYREEEMETWQHPKQEVMACADTPTLGDDFITLYPLVSPLSRRCIRRTLVGEISWDYTVQVDS